MTGSWMPFLIAAATNVAKTKGKTKGPQQEGVWKYIDMANDFVNNPNFEAAIRSPVFWGISVVVLGISIFRGWKGFLICYVGAVALWGIVHHTVLKDQSGDAGSSSVMIFAALTIGVAGLAIYFLLIRD